MCDKKRTMKEFLINAINDPKINKLLWHDYLIIKTNDSINVGNIEALANYYFHNYKHVHVYELSPEPHNYDREIRDLVLEEQPYNLNECIFPIVKIEYEEFKDLSSYLIPFVDHKKMLENKINEHSKLLPRASLGPKSKVEKSRRLQNYKQSNNQNNHNNQDNNQNNNQYSKQSNSNQNVEKSYLINNKNSDDIMDLKPRKMVIDMF